MQDDLKPLLAALDEIGPELHRLLARITLCEHAAEELLQQIVLKVLQRPRQRKEIQNWPGYLRRAAINAAFNWRRDRKSTSNLSSSHVAAAVQSNGVDRSEIHEQVEQILAALDAIPESYREVVLLRYLQGQPYDDIAAQLGKSPHQVRSLCSKGLQAVRKKLRVNTASIGEDR